ncbi:hypothetical protein FOMPIDRAFT_52737 [Fomitopsis schrenkii]|uniref:GED domain-containing protein n=1 Tax=Fomitopsis schrenkii TaxID=2126942 RepID=S8DZV4_FOMSC|nr:hypothetical protein FOMPIDRAFT_52737 [Fomitopsis schrenkii]
MLDNSDQSTNDVAVVDVVSAGSYTYTRRSVFDLLNSLYGTGVTTDIDIPMIIALGVQSTGKSSLLESVCGITLPRSGGTCTRCPTECRLLCDKTSPWKCIVKLRWLTDKRGQSVPVREEPFGEPIHDPADVAERVKRAQCAILSPDSDSKTFLRGELITPELLFSKNCVSLEISGPDVIDLSLVDLPGLISSTVDGDNTPIEMIRTLAEEYARNENCIILLTVSCETEFENQGAYQLAHTFDPDGKRTIGVLTKPDRVGRGDEQKWITVLKNEHKGLELDNGWFSVKQPDTVQLEEGITRAEARQAEEKYFESTSHWASLPLKFRQRLGTDNLAERCSELLSALVIKQLPAIQRKVQELLRATEGELHELPNEPSKDPIGEVFNVISRFSSALAGYVEGTPGKDGLLQSIRPEQKMFWRELRKTAPDFGPYNKPDTADIIQRRNGLTKPGFLSNEQEVDMPAGDDEAIYINEVMASAEQAVTRELPDNIPFTVTENYIRSLTARWEAPAIDLFEGVEEILRSKITDFVHAECKQYPQLEAQISVVVLDYIAERAQATRERIKWLLALEERPRTVNDQCFRDYFAKFLAWYRGDRTEYNDVPFLQKLKNTHDSSSSTFDCHVRSILSSYNALGVNPQPVDLAKVLPPDPYESAIAIMAGTRAYFQVACKRFADNVSNAIDHELVLGLNRDHSLDKVLREQLGISGPNGYQSCADILREDGRVTTQRADLRNKRDRLQKAKKELTRLRK